jgi:rod shape-determining protein MreD
MKIFNYTLLFVVLVFSQVFILPYFAIGHFVPDVIFIGVIVLGLREGGVPAMIAGTLAGFFRDAFTTGFLGSSMLGLVIAGFLAGIFSRLRLRLRIKGNLTFLFIIAFMYNFVFYFLQLFDTRLTLTSLLLQFIIPAVFYTLIIVGIAHFLIPQGLWGRSKI